MQDAADKKAANPEDDDEDAAMNGENDPSSSNGVHDEDDDDDEEDEDDDSDEDDEKEFYCKPCKKQFTKQSVFDSHLKGRKHKKALKIQTGVCCGVGTRQQLLLGSLLVVLVTRRVLSVS